MSTVYYSFKWPAGPREVVVTGEFDEWKGSFRLEKTPTGEFEITLPVKVPEEENKVFFKFIVDGEWITSGFYKTATDPAGIENNYVPKEELVQLAKKQKHESEDTSVGVVGAAGTAASSETPTKTRSAAGPKVGGTPEAVIARSSRTLDVRPATPQSASSSVNTHRFQHQQQQQHHHHHHHGNSQDSMTTTNVSSTPNKNKELYLGSERDASYGAANAANAASAEFPTSSTADDPLAAAAAASALRKVKIKRRVKRNKKTGERIVVSEERIPLDDDEDEGALGNSTFEEEEFSPPKKGTPSFSKTTTGPIAGSAGTPTSVSGTETPTPNRQKHLQQRGPLGSVNSPSSSPSIRKTRPLSVAGTIGTKSPSAGPSRSGSVKERPVSSIGLSSSPSRPKSNVPVGSSSSSTAAAGANAATSSARKERPTSTIIGDSTPGSGRKTISRGSSIKRNAQSPGANGPLGTRLPANSDEEAFHILPIGEPSQSQGDNAAFKSLASEPGPFIPNNQDQLKAFSKVNDDVDPEAFNERLNKQYKAEHETPKKNNSKKASGKLGTNANAGDLGNQANVTNLEKSPKSDVLGKLKNDENLEKFGKDAAHGKVNKKDTLNTLKNDKGNLTDVGKQLASESKEDGSLGTSTVDTDSTPSSGAKNALNKLDNDESLKQLGKDTAQGKVNKKDALGKLGQDSTLKGTGKTVAVGALGGDSSIEDKSKGISNQASKGAKRQGLSDKKSQKALQKNQGTQSKFGESGASKLSPRGADGEEKRAEDPKTVPKKDKTFQPTDIDTGNRIVTAVEEYGYLPGKTAEELDEDDFFAYGGTSTKGARGDISSAFSPTPGGSAGTVDSTVMAPLGGVGGVDSAEEGKLSNRKKTTVSQDKGKGLSKEIPSRANQGKQESSITSKGNELDREADLLDKEAGSLGKNKAVTTGQTGVPKQMGASGKRVSAAAEPLGKRESRELQKKKELQERRELQMKKESEGRKKRESKKTKSQNKRDNVPTLDPRVRKSTIGSGAPANKTTTEPESQQFYEVDTDSEEGNEVYLDPMTRGTPEDNDLSSTKIMSKGTPSSASSATATDTTGTTGITGTTGTPKRAFSKTNRNAPTPNAKKNATDSTSPAKVDRNSVADSEIKRNSSLQQAKEVGPKRASSIVKKEDRNVPTKTVPDNTSPVGAVADAGSGTSGSKSTTGNKSSKETSNGLLKRGKSKVGATKGKNTKNISANLINPDNTGVEGGKNQKGTAKDILEQGKSEAEKAKTKDTKGIVTDTVKSGKNEVKNSKGNGIKGALDESGANKKPETGEGTATAGNTDKAGSPEASGRKSPAQSAVANIANRADKKRKVGLWARVKRVLQ